MQRSSKKKAKKTLKKRAGKQHLRYTMAHLSNKSQNLGFKKTKNPS